MSYSFDSVVDSCQIHKHNTSWFIFLKAILNVLSQIKYLAGTRFSGLKPACSCIRGSAVIGPRSLKELEEVTHEGDWSVAVCFVWIFPRFQDGDNPSLVS